MKTIQKVVFLISILLAANANAGRWITRDPIGFMERDPHPTMSANLNLSVGGFVPGATVVRLPAALQTENLALRLDSPNLFFGKQTMKPNSFLLGSDVNLYTYVNNNPVNEIDPNGLWGVMIGGINFGHGNPTFDFDFNKQEWANLRNQYRRNEGTCFIVDATANKASAVNPNPLNLGAAAFFDGALLGSAAGYGIADFGEAFSGH
jgi:hypothetical protein